MSKNKPKQPAQRPAAHTAAPKPAQAVALSGDFSVKYPLLWLALAALAVYFPSFSFGFTELDDSIFIRDFHEYNENLGNLITSFHRGVFDAVRDSYYRPLFLDTMILNYQASGLNEAGYHVVNVIFHIVSVLLLYKLFRKLNVKDLHAFILCIIFAIHPVLSEAVAWIPGRNDTLLAIFTLSFFIFSIDYTETGKAKHLLLSTLFLILAFFTKETAIFDAPIAFILLIVVLQKNWLDKRNLVQYGTWLGCFLLWIAARSAATLQPIPVTGGQMASDFFHRLPLIIQYTGKIFFPFNLSVFPILEDTVYYYGIAAVIVLGVIIFLNKERNWRVIGSGLAIFIVLLLPVLFVPKTLNEQTFEHRLYLPIMGMLLALSQTALFKNKLQDRQLFISFMVACGLLAGINYYHQRNFANPVVFWSQAMASSPHSAYATMMLAARTEDTTVSYSLFHRAYQLNPKEKYLNFYYGVMLQKRDSVPQSEQYLLYEKNTSGYYECDFYLARVAMERRDVAGAATYLRTYVAKDPTNKIANTNLLLLYLDTQQRDSAIVQVKRMRLSGVDVPPQVAQRLGL